MEISAIHFNFGKRLVPECPLKNEQILLVNLLSLALASGLLQHFVKEPAFKHLLECIFEVRLSVELLIVLAIDSALRPQFADDLV